MEMKDTLSSCSNSGEQEMQQMHKQAKIPFSMNLDVSVVKSSTLVHNRDNLAKQLNTEVLYKKDFKCALSLIKIQCKVQEIKVADASLGDIDSSGFVSDKGNTYISKNDCSKTSNDQSSGQQSSTSGNERSRPRNECNKRSNSRDDTDIRPFYDTELMVDSNTTPDSSDMCNNEFKDDQYADDHEDERVVLSNLIANLKLDTDKNKKIQKQSKRNTHS
ncbi:hypothetical protein Tco_0360834 [Tanacetum coccineum]